MTQVWHLYLMGLFYIVAGINHFRKPSLYYKIIPPVFSNKMFFNELTGLLEFSFGVCLFFPSLYNISCWFIIVLLLLIFPSNVYMLMDKNASLGLPKWLLIVRLPLQIVLILWAYYYTTPLFIF